MNCVKINNQLETHLYKQPSLDYKVNLPMHRTYNLPNGITSGVEFEMLLTSFQHECSCMFIFIQKSGDTLANSLHTYKIDKIKITDSNSQSLQNAIYNDTTFLQNMYAKQWFRGSDFFVKNANYIYLLTFANDPRSTILENKYSGSVRLNDNKLFVNPLETLTDPAILNVIFISPSYLRMTNKLSLHNS